MAKTKNKRNSGMADKVQYKKKKDFNKKKLNPFEVHINREKIKVLGKKSKHDRGLPGVSRAKAIQKRKDTLGTEMKLMNKTNTFIDKRIGEKNNELSAEDRMIARFAAERAKQHSKKNMYNLADDEILTHRGQTLEQIEKFDDPRSDDEDDDEGKKFGGLDNDFVSEGHFGGGMLSKSEKDGAKSHKDLIEQLIAESKKRKAEKQKEKEQTLDLTEKLDSEWKDLQPVVFKRPRIENEKESIIDKLLSQAEKRNEDYDKMMRELKFDRRGTPSDGLKNDEKQAKEEQKRLELLEKERLQRMIGEEDDRAKVQAKPKHRSADDLDDNFVLDDEKEFMLAYDNEGKPLVPEHILKDYSVPNAKPKFDDGVSDTSSEDDGEESEEDSDENSEETENVKVSDKKAIGVQNKNDSEQSEESSDESDEKSVEKNVNNIQNKDKSKESDKQSDKDEENEVNKETNNKIVEDSKLKENKVETNVGLFQNGDASGSDSEEDEGEETSDEQSEESEETKEKFNDLKDLKMSDEESDNEIDEQDESKIVSFFDFKEDDNNLMELLSGKTPSQQSTTLQKLIKSYDPSLAEKNKDLLTRLYAHMLQYINDIFTNVKNEGELIKSFLVFDKLAPYFYDLTHTNKVSTKKFIVELLKEKHKIFQKHPKKIPDLDTLIFFKLISLLYPTSDFRHPVTTPSLIFMSEILAHSKFNDAHSISRGFFLVALILEYTALSKRYVPSALNFLRGILYLCSNTSVLNPIQVVPPFKLHRDVKLLNLENDCSKLTVDNKMATKDLVAEEITDDFKIRSFYVASLMLKEFFDNFNEIQAQQALFEPHLQLYNRIDLDMYPKKVKKTVEGITKYMRECLEMKTYTPLGPEKERPKALRLYEPDIQEVFTGSKNAKLSREQADRVRLKSKLKREMKGALREIRRDKAYIASVKIRQKIQSDNIRKDKVKQIYKDASIQQGELNKLKRMK